MINFLIKLLDKLQSFLKNVQLKNIESQKEGLENNNIQGDHSIKNIFLGLIGSIFPLLSVIAVSDISGFIDNYIFILLLTIVINVFFVFTFVKNLNGKYLYLVHFPLYIGLFSLLSLLIPTNILEFGLFNIYLNLFIIVFPIIFILQYYIKYFDNKYINYIKNIAYFYNLGFFLIITLNVLIISLGINLEFIGPWSKALIIILGENYISGLIEGLLYLLVVGIMMLYWVYTLNIYFDNIGHKRINIHRALIVFLFVYCLGFLPVILDHFYDYQISKATDIVAKGGDNYETYRDARVWFLDEAYLSKIKNGEYIDQALFNKIYDNTIFGYYGDKIGEFTTDSRSFATNSAKILDSANVNLSLAEISNHIKETQGSQKISILETTYKFHLTNETNENQEVKLNFEAPNKLSVVTGLRLGMDLQLEGQIAPRGAASKVYENSLRKNIDPALLEKVGINTYSLKVFPIPSKTGNTQGRQLVEVKMITPITDENLLYSPKFSFINLKILDNSRLQSKIYNKDELIKEDVIKSADIEKYLSTDHILKTSELKLSSNKKLSEICLSPIIQASVVMNNYKLNIDKKIGNKINIYFDNSRSVETNKSNKLYSEIYDNIKHYNGKLNDVDMYAYNFDVTKLTGVEDINYWGYSDIDRAIDYIVNNKISNESIVFVTDDDSFNLNINENNTRNLSTLLTNKISVIKIGKKVKTYKSDFNTILSATNGNIYQLNDKSDISSVLNKVLDNSTNEKLFKECKLVVVRTPISEYDNMSNRNDIVKDENNTGFVDKLYSIDETEINDNTGTIVNTGILDSSGVLDNSGSIESSGTLDNSGSLDNTGSIEKSTNNNSIIENSETIDINIEKIQAGIISNILLANIRNENDWYQIANIQNTISNDYNIVNQFNSLIAIETEQQQRELDNYKNNGNKYDTTYDNNAGNNINTITRNNSRGGMFNNQASGIPYCHNADECGLRQGMSDISEINSNGSSGYRRSGGINPGVGVNSALRTEGSIGYTSGIDMSFGGDTHISIMGLIMMLIYLSEFGLFISFLLKYIRGNKVNNNNL